MDWGRESRKARAGWNPHLPQDMREEVRKALSRLGLSELRREPRKGEQLDRQTKDYIRTLRDKEDEPEQLSKLKDVVQAARCQAGTARQYLQQSRPALDCTVHTLHTFLQAPAGWFLALCEQHDVVLALRPTFPRGHPCGELRQAAAETMYLQLCVNEHRVPPQLIVKEVRQQHWGEEGSGQDVGDPCLVQPLPGMSQSQDSRRMLNTETSLCVLSSRSGDTDRQDKLNQACITENHRLSEPLISTCPSRKLRSRYMQLKEATAACQTNDKNDKKPSLKETCDIQLTVLSKTSSDSGLCRRTPADRKAASVETSRHRSVTKLAWSSDSQHESSVSMDNVRSPGLSRATTTSSTVFSSLHPSCLSIHVDAVRFTPDEDDKDLSHNAQTASNSDMHKARSTVVQNSVVDRSGGEVANSTLWHSTRVFQCSSADKLSPKDRRNCHSDNTQVDGEVRPRDRRKCHNEEIQAYREERLKDPLKGHIDNTQVEGGVRPREWQRRHTEEILTCGEVRSKDRQKGLSKETYVGGEVKPKDQLKGHNEETRASRDTRPKDRLDQLKGHNDETQGGREVRSNDLLKAHSEETQAVIEVKSGDQQKDHNEETRVDGEARPRDILMGHSNEIHADGEVRPKDQLKGHSEETHVTGKARSGQAQLRDVTVVRESREALVPERSGSRVFVRGHYVQRDTQQVLPFMLFVHMERSTTTLQPGPTTLSGSYVRRMLTTNKNLRWRFRHVIPQ